MLGVDPEVILATSHGRRSVDTLKLYDPSLATPECMSASSLIRCSIFSREQLYGGATG